MTDEFATMTAEVLSQLGTPGQVSRAGGPATAVMVSDRRSLLAFGDVSRGFGSQRIIGFDRSVWSPKRGDVVVIGAASLTVESIESDDGYFVEAVVNA